MSYQVLGFTHTLVAGEDLSSSLSCFVSTSGGEAVLPDAGGPVVGVLISNPVEGSEASFQFAGVARVKFGGTVEADDYVKVDATGRAVTASAGDVAAGLSVGKCLVGGAEDGYGSVLLALFGLGITSITGSESPSPVAGNYNLDEYTADSLITLGTANRTGALADGIQVGQRKRIMVIAASGGFTYALTPATMLAGQPTSFTFTAVGQMVELTWTAAGWRVTEVKTAGAGTTADAGTINPLIARQGLTINGTEDRILPSGWVPGHQISIFVDTDTSGSTTISGLFYDEDGSADGVDVTYNDALDSAVYTWNGARWMLSDIVSVTVS